MKRLCVFCGSSRGTRESYLESAQALGTALAARGIELVYGGSDVGLMGAIADATLAAGGRVTGVMPQGLVDREIEHKGLSHLHIVGTMHERKAMMAELSDGFIALPGGYGTLEEFTEILTWGQLGMHRKPFGILNIEGFYDGLLTFFDHIVTEQFVQPEFRQMIQVATTPDALLDLLASYEAPHIVKWIDKSEV
jgi:uncharacterized protein (TIGR00730 family)